MRKQRLLIVLVIAIVTIAVYGLFFSKLLPVHGGGDTTITVVLKSLNVRSDYWQAISSGAETAAKELGVKLDLQGPLQESDADGQVQAIRDAIARKPDAIAVAPVDDPRMPELLDEVRDAGIKLVVMDMPLVMKTPPTYVANDHRQAGKLAGDAAAEVTSGRPVVAVFSDNEKSPIANERIAGLKQAVEARGGSVAETYYSGDSEQLAYEFTVALLRSDLQVNAFVTLNENATLGVAKALKEANKTGMYKLIGFGNSIYEIQLLEEGTVGALVVPKPFNVGYLGVKTAMKLVDGDRVQKTTLISSAVVTRGNMYEPVNQHLLFPFTDIE